MISPRLLTNTGVCGLFCATLISIHALELDKTPSLEAKSAPVAALDYTLHVHTINSCDLRTPALVWTPNATQATHAARNRAARAKIAELQEVLGGPAEAAAISVTLEPVASPLATEAAKDGVRLSLERARLRR
ncbi:MAG: hypothetical protein H0U74_09235 [Bradymonadaceae bacterium]|nr:hypothetical protein [Lujinxingiaceae bacterium]